jgi:hypothetical protein
MYLWDVFMKKLLYMFVVLLYAIFGSSGFATSSPVACNPVGSSDLCLALRTFAAQAVSLLSQKQTGGDLRGMLESAWQPVEIIIRKQEQRSGCFPNAFSLEMAADEFKSRISAMASATTMGSAGGNKGTSINTQFDLDMARARLLQFCLFF